MSELNDEDGDAIPIPIDGALDLHAFSPGELGELIPEYLGACREQGILEVRIIHGKGRGALRRSVQAILARLPFVLDHHLAGEGRGGWGATMAVLAPLERREKD